MAVRRELILNMGPQHPSTHGVLRLLLELEGERVRNAEVMLGYAHRGVEKMAEFRTIPQFNPILDRIDYVSSILYEWCFIGVVEKALGIKIPKRADYIVFDAREKILDIFEMISGSRMMPNFICVGGVKRDITADFYRAVKEFIRYTRERMDDLDVLVTGNIIFIKRTKGIGIITEDMVYKYSLTGPVARGSGIPMDVRVW